MMSLAATAGLSCGARTTAPKTDRTNPNEAAPIEALELQVGGRIGLFAVNKATGRVLNHRADERFAMASTFKWVLAAAVLAQLDSGSISSEEELPFNKADLLEHAPFTRPLLVQGFANVRDLAQAIVTVSDNTAANLLLKRIGGTKAFTSFVKEMGDSTTRLDRLEPFLNTNEPEDDRDTTSPRAMVGLMDRILCGTVLSRESQQCLHGWMRMSETGKRRLRAGLPQGVVVGDKTGTGARGAVNDIAIVTRASGHSILIAAYLSGSTSSLDRLEEAHAEIGSIVSRTI